MAYDELLAERIRDHLEGMPVVEKRMFGGLAFLLDGHLAVSASGGGGLLVRVPADDSEDLLEEQGVERMRMGERVSMAGWLQIAPDVLTDDAVLARWIDRSVDHVRSLPAS